MTQKTEANSVAVVFKNIQSFIAVGYLFLLLIGVVSYSILYRLIGINILHYSNVLDLLLSPVAIFIETPAVLALLIISIILFWLVNEYLVKKLLKQNNALSVNELSGEAQEKYKKYDENRWKTPVLYAFFLYFGFAIGRGIELNSVIKSGEFELNHQIVLMDNSSHEIRLLSANSQYIFYLKKGDKSVNVSPISGNVKTIRKLTQAEK